MNFRWDKNKDLLNKEKYDVTFTEAKRVLKDPFHISMIKRRFDNFNERWVSIGATYENIVVVGYDYIIGGRGEEVVQIHTARKATLRERSIYEWIRI